MTAPLWTKFFYFSASFSRGLHVYGHNYTLAVICEFTDKLDETVLENKIQAALIQKIHSRDLSLDVDFLKNMEITDYNLLKVFSEIISKQIHPVRLHALSLERDSRTKLLLPATSQ